MSDEIKVGEVRDYFEPLIDGEFPSEAMEVIQVTNQEVFYLPADIDRTKIPRGYMLRATRENFLSWYPTVRTTS